jgi:hypothetical protein
VRDFNQKRSILAQTGEFYVQNGAAVARNGKLMDKMRKSLRKCTIKLSICDRIFNQKRIMLKWVFENIRKRSKTFENVRKHSKSKAEYSKIARRGGLLWIKGMGKKSIKNKDLELGEKEINMWGKLW